MQVGGMQPCITHEIDGYARQREPGRCVRAKIDNGCPVPAGDILEGPLRSSNVCALGDKKESSICFVDARTFSVSAASNVLA